MKREDMSQESGVRMIANKRDYPFRRLWRLVWIMVCLGGWWTSAHAWTITNINIGTDLNSAAWGKVNNNNNTIVGVLNAQAVSNAWLASQIGSLTTNTVTGVQPTNAPLPSIAGGTLFVPTNPPASGPGMVWFTNNFTTNYATTNVCVFMPKDVQLYVLCVTNDSTTGWVKNDVISGGSMLECAINSAAGGNAGPCPVVDWSGTNIITMAGGAFPFVQSYAPMVFPYKSGQGEAVPASIFNFVMVLRVSSQ